VPVPKRRTGKTRRNTHLVAPSLIQCPSCGEAVTPHRVCPKCGHYKDRLVINVGKD